MALAGSGIVVVDVVLVRRWLDENLPVVAALPSDPT
jgi:hypothetical protein